ncbi:hypothetical protein [Liquorilactobacillus mali]|uniref:Uncharacterized protein n=1 Tax=Liquorilactobacillus mali KCTC 3596 = DSM 20444 TaxID=1046596 RepID=A0A0R2EAI1_9LACO|nr:hypothetical protein [Liquorilactobacillus mali]KRN09356.1 hypothetical protein FD00_GL001079 [Liquorilactobacillus mali KCTC 3596 = DSM 20444]
MENKFRGLTSKGKMIYGALLFNSFGTMFISEFGSSKAVSYPWAKLNPVKVKAADEYTKVDDRVGIQVFANDIFGVKITDENGAKREYGVVELINGQYGVKYSSGLFFSVWDIVHGLADSDMLSFDHMVKGNIYNNSYLLNK